MVNLNCMAEEKISATVIRTIFNNPQNGYTVAQVQDTQKGKGDGVFTLRCCLPFPLREGDDVEVEGHWVIDRRYGKQFQAIHFRIVAPTTRAGIKAYLSSGIIGGIGPAIAERITSMFGEDSLTVLDNDPDKLKCVKGIGEKTLEKIILSWKDRRAGAVILMSLCELGLSVAYATKVFKKFGVESIEIVKENPYKLTEVRGIGFLKADEIACTVLSFEPDHPYRVQAGIIYALENSARTQGHCFLYGDELIKRSVECLSVESAIVESVILRMLSQKALVFHDERYYLPAFYGAERYLESKLNSLCSFSPSRAKLASSTPWNDSLTDEQKDAVQIALSNGLSVITGGPGTGKTTTLKALIDILEALKINYVMAAPTGKAAKRMNEVTGREAKTLHRLLEFNATGSFNRHKGSMLEADLVIVDESSMVDIFLMAALVDALPMHASLVLIGDSDQLPPVGPGNVFKDIISSGICPVIRFVTIHRQAENSGIVKSAYEVLKGQKLSITEAEPDAPGNGVLFLENDDVENILNSIVYNITEVLPQAGVSMDDLQILSPMRRGPIGTESINKAIQQKLHGDKPPGQRLGKLFLGDRVIQLSNDYDKNVFNGDIGYVLSVNPEGDSLAVRFDAERVVPYEILELDDLDLAYALTVHKSQGSEWLSVVILMHEQHYIMLKRDLLYTAITRAKESLILIGTKKAVSIAIRNNKENKRNTGLWK